MRNAPFFSKKYFIDDPITVCDDSTPPVRFFGRINE
jgi:hypothetical protein